MNGHRDENPSSCHFHPDVAFVGVCPLCLNERLVVLAAKQSHPRRSVSGHAFRAHHHHPSVDSSKKPPLNIPKIFAIGTLFNRLEFRQWRADSLDDAHEASSSPEDDSFISIKFEDNGVASWEKNKVSNVSLNNCNNISWNHRNPVGKAPALKDVKATTTTKSVIEHPKPRVASLRWRKRIGHLFQLIRWKRSGKAGSVCHVGSKVEGLKVRNGWMRTLTKRKGRE